MLRRWQRQFRYLLVDEFQDANVAQIELIELLGRTPDRPDNVMVVGDDDQSIYRFRGASFAAFAEFNDRFARPPAHDPNARPPGPPPRLRIEQNFRSVENVLTAANRLIGNNETRFEPDKRLVTDRPQGDPIELLVCAGPEDEAVAIVDAIKSMVGEGTGVGKGTGGRWTDVAILYRKHKHREPIVARLRDEDIPYTVVGGLSLFETPEIRDLEQAMRAITDPHDDVALVRMMTAGPWRLDALEILRVTRMAKFDRAHLLETVKAIVESGRVEVDRVADRHEETQTAGVAAPAGTRAKLRQLLGALDELNPLTFREGPHTILERYLERTGQVLDLIAADTLESKRTVTNIASFLRFAADWQAASPNGTLAGFVAYLDAYQAAGGELPTSVELSEDVDGVRLMTLYQAKGLEFPIVFVPNLLDGEWPVKEQGDGLFPRELLREAVPAGDIHTDEERRLLYVAMTRAQERLILTTHGGAAAQKEASRFVGEILDGAGIEVRRIDRTAATADAVERRRGASAVRPRRRRRHRSTGRPGRPGRPGRRRPAGHAAAVRPRAPARAAPAGERARRAHGGDERHRPGGPGRPRRPGVGAGDPRPLGGDDRRRRARPGARPAHVPHARARLRRRRQPAPGRAAAGDAQLLVAQHATSAARSSTRSATSTGCRRGRSRSPRSRSARPRTRRSRRSPGIGASDSPGATRRRPARTSSASSGRAGPRPGFGDKTTEEGYQRRVATLLDNFWQGEVSSLGEALHEELPFELTLEPGRRLGARRHPPARSTGSTACHRAASRSSTTRPAASHRRRASTRASSCRSTRSPAATHWAWARPNG